MVGPGFEQTLAVAGPAVTAGAEADDRHSRRPGRLHPGRRVLEDQHLRWPDPERPRRVQIDVGMRLAPLDMLGGAEQAVAEMMGQAEALEGIAQPPGRARRRHGFRDRRKRFEESLHSGHGRDFLHPKLEGLFRAGSEVGGQRPSNLGLDDHDRVAPVEADIAFDRLLQSGGMPQFRQGFGEDEVGQDLAVDDDAVEIEYQCGKSQLRSPNRAVPTLTWVAPIATAAS